MPRWLVFTVLLILLVCIAAAGYFSFTLFSLSQKIVVTSQYKGQELLSKNTQSLNNYLIAIHFWNESQIPAGSGDLHKRVSAKQLRIVLTDKEQPYDKIVAPNSNDKVYSSWGITATSNGVVTLYIHLNLDLLKGTAIKTDRHVNKKIFDALYQVAQGGIGREKTIEPSEVAKFDPVDTENFFVKIEPKKSVLQKLIGTIIPTVYAQTCGGNIECGTWFYPVGTCVGGPNEGNVCLEDTDCQPPFTAYCDRPARQCQGEGNLTPCSAFYNNQTECNQNDPLACGSFSCVAQRTCAWNPGGGGGPICGNGICESGESCSTCSTDCGTCGTPAPPPTPGPTTEPPPPGGSCNSGCGTCGYLTNGGGCSSNDACCHRSCSSGTCTTVFGGGTQECVNEGEACAPPPGTSPSPTATPLSTCSITVSPISATRALGATQPFVASATRTSGSANFSSIVYTNTNPAVASNTPASCSCLPGAQCSCTTTATGLTTGSTTLQARANFLGGGYCDSSASTLTIVPPAPWWRAKDGDIITNGSISSIIPGNAADPKLIQSGPGGFPGVAIYGTTAVVNPADPNISATNWNTASGYSFSTANYGYTALSELGPQVDCSTPGIDPNQTLCYTTITENRIPAGNLIQSRVSKGYHWLKRTGDLEVHGTQNLSNIGGCGAGNQNQCDKVILLVENGNLVLGRTDTGAGLHLYSSNNSGFFVAAVTGNITVLPNTSNGVNGGEPAIEGMFLTDKKFVVQTQAPTNNDSQFWLRGAVAAGQGITLTRNLKTLNDPAEYFEFAPEMILAWPRELTRRQLIWREVAP